MARLAEKGGNPELEKEDKEMKIIVEGKPKTVTEEHLDFEQIVKLAFEPEDPPTGEFIEFTVIFRRGHPRKPDGNLKEGERVKIKEGMVINVTATDKS